MDTLKKLSTATKAALLSDFPRSSVHKLSKVLLLTSVSTVLTASPGWSVTVAPTSMTVVVPTGSNNTQADNNTYTYTGSGGTAGTGSALTSASGNPTGAGTAFVDDILLQSITFGTTTFQTSTTSFADTQRSTVISGRANINAEFGDQDLPSNGGSDGNPNPFVSAGVATSTTDLSGETNATRESTNPSIQDPALTAAFNSLSISQGIDGETTYVYRAIFDRGISEANNTSDNTPELIFFERGVNSTFRLRAITGGNLNDPILAANTVTVAAANLTPSGVFIDTSEISVNNGQQLGVVGIDLSDFGVAANTAIYGIQLESYTTDGTQGADIYGNFAIGASGQFSNVPSGTTVPEPSTIFGSAIALVVGVFALKQQAKNTQLQSEKD